MKRRACFSKDVRKLLPLKPTTISLHSVVHFSTHFLSHLISGSPQQCTSYLWISSSRRAACDFFLFLRETALCVIVESNFFTFSVLQETLVVVNCRPVLLAGASSGSDSTTKCRFKLSSEFWFLSLLCVVIVL